GDAALLALKAAGRTVGRAMSPIDGDPEGRKVQASSRVLRSDVPDKSPTALRARLTASAQGDLDVQRTVVFLLDRFELDPIYWPVRAAAAIEADDSYRFDHVRPGSYYPVAINFADNDGVQIGAYGFYDADGDLSPDAVTVGSEPVDSVRLTLFPYETTTAMTGRVLAENRAKSIVPDAVLTGIRGGGVATDGTAPEWIYVFHSPTESSALVITVDPVTVDARIDTSADTGASDIPITTDVLDSDTALAIAWERGGSSFSASYDPSDVTISLEGGNVRHIFPLESDDLIWAVNFRAEGGTDSLLVVLDMKNGEEVDITAISSELHPGKEETTIVGVFPNPFGQVASVDFAVSRPGRVVLEVLDMLGRQRAVVVDDHFETGRHGIVWQPRDLESGVFVLRLRSGEATSTAKVIRIR
ncbi:MAG: T9SS type A sorting domain-containing protein, partial [Rhodothermales bacterium]